MFSLEISPRLRLVCSLTLRIVRFPDHLNAGFVLEKIRSSLVSLGHRGTVSITAYGDTTKDHHLPSEGVKLNHFPAGGDRYARHSKILEDIVSWSAEHPEPPTLLLVMGEPTCQMTLPRLFNC